LRQKLAVRLGLLFRPLGVKTLLNQPLFFCGQGQALALGSGGGYLAGSARLIDYLGLTTPAFVFSTSSSPPNAAAALEAVRVGTADRRVQPGEPVVTVGCNGGADPTIHQSRITAVDKYLGPANVQVAGQPVQGRSGGGLFAIDGTLIGVCNAADPADNEGLFAALPAIHEQLEEAELAFVYRNVYPSGGLKNLALRGVETPVADVFPDGIVEQKHVLADQTDRRT